MKLLIFADLHDDIKDLSNLLTDSEYDLILTLGDIEFSTLKLIKQYAKTEIIGIEGNHDFHGDLKRCNIENIHMKKVSFNGISFGGFGGSVQYKDNNDFVLYSQLECFAELDNLEPVDIFIAHNSPFGINDKEDLAHQGFKGINNYLDVNKPKLYIHGHQHVDLEITLDNEVSLISVYGYAFVDTDGYIKEN